MSTRISRIGPKTLWVLSWLLVSALAIGQTKENCDSIIRKGIEAMNKSEHVQSLELLSKARKMAERNNWAQQEFLAVNNIGANYYLLLEYGEALNYYLEAYTIALRKLEPKFEMVVLNNIAILYSKENKFDKAKEYFTKAYDIAKENNDELKMGLYAMNLGNVANEVKDTKLARRYFEEAIPRLGSLPEVLLMAKIGIADCDLSEGKWESARAAGEALYPMAQKMGFDNVKVAVLTLLAKANLKLNNLAKAEVLAHQLASIKPNLETKITLFELLSDVHFKARHYEKALQYKDSIIKANVELEAMKNGKLLETNKAKFEISNYKNELKLKEAKLASERKIFYSVIAVIIVIVFFVVLTLRNLSVKHKQKKLIAERNQQILELELEKEKHEHLLREKQHEEKETIALLEQERLKNELEARNRKLSAKALYLSGRNEMIEDVLSRLSQTPQLSGDVALSGQIKTLKSHLKADSEWDDFITHFEQVNHSFLNSIKTKHPNLTSNDIRFLSYIYMNLSNKEIASMLNITVEACRKRKERLASKMELVENSNLYDYLASL